MNIFEFTLQTVIPYTIGSAFQAMQLPETRSENAIEIDASDSEEHSRTQQPVPINSDHDDGACLMSSGRK